MRKRKILSGWSKGIAGRKMPNIFFANSADGRTGFSGRVSGNYLFWF
ncbi:hypothetical protein HZB78_02325 [Candidatus Collierbacteria bacterium]|nr:hypothetical protein [Candidatus Collierbacteria bacterium]